MQRDLGLNDVSYAMATVKAGQDALGKTVGCYHVEPPITDTNKTRVDGLSEELQQQTNARAEALHLSFRNALLALDGGSDAAHRIYGCLYGLELYAGQNPVPVVPPAVSTASAIQKLFSGLMIFLFGLALRNMLKVK